MVQDFSFPYSPSSPILSINAHMDSSLYPCTWGTFATMALCMARLPPGSQAAARDEAEAYRTMPLHPSQWNGTVVRVGDDAFNLDTCLLFGLAPSAGIYGACADAANNIMRAEGIGPIVKWVDDKVFFRLPKPALTSFNATRAQLCTEIAKNGARHHEGGRWWYHAGLLQDGRIIECDEDTVFPLKDLSNASPRSAYEASFTYSMADIDRIAVPMGIPCDWERSKDIPFGTVIHYIGLEWDIARHTVALPHGKREKYRAAISHHAHARPGAEPLWQAAPHYPGGPGLTRLEIFMDIGVHGGSPCSPETGSHKAAISDGQRQLASNSSPALSSHCTARIATSSASATTPESSKDGGRMVEGLQQKCPNQQHNPADAPSRGRLGHPHRLLPPVPLPKPLQPYLRDATDPRKSQRGSPDSRSHLARRLTAYRPYWHEQGRQTPTLFPSPDYASHVPRIAPSTPTVSSQRPAPQMVATPHLTCVLCSRRPREALPVHGPCLSPPRSHRTPRDSSSFTREVTRRASQRSSARQSPRHYS
jgi:hypothetical protein